MNGRHTGKADNIRAILILIVVFAHSIILYSSRWKVYQPLNVCPLLDETKAIIDVFLMPMFFSLSGYLFAMSSAKPGWGRFVWKKTKRLLIPFVLVGILYMIPLKMLVGYPGYQGKSYPELVTQFLTGTEQGHLWYLPVLFLLFLLVFPLQKYLRDHPAGWVCLTVILMGVHLSWDILPAFGLPYLKNLYKFSWGFAMGGMFCRFLPRQGKTTRGWVAAALALLAAGELLRPKTTLPLAVAILLFLYLFIPEQGLELLKPFARNGFGMYLFHSPMIYITFTWLLDAAPWIIVSINFLLFGTAAFWLTELVRRTPMRIMLGEEKR